MAWDVSSATEAAQSAADVVFGCRDEAERGARMAPAAREAIGGAGLFALAVPVEHGGREAPLPDLVGAVEVIGAADPSAAWHLCNTIAVPLAAAHLDAVTRAEIFGGDLRRPFCVSNSPAGTATRAGGGWRLDGDWPFLTGVLDAEWVVVAARLAASGSEVPTGGAGAPPEVGLFVTPTSTLDVRTTWPLAAAMRGTGSNAASLHDMFVEERFATSWWAPLVLDRPLYRISLPAMVLLATGAVALGVLRACLDATIGLVGSRVSRADGLAYADKPRTQEAVAESEAALRSLRAGYHAAMGVLWDQAGERPLTPRDEAPALAATFHAIDGARDAVGRLYLAATPVVYARSNVVERSLRDIFAISVGVEGLRTFNLHHGRRLLRGS